MPTTRSNFSRYPIPDNQNPSGIVCIQVAVPDDRQWIAQFMGALWRMTLQTHYERDAEHSAVGLAARWRAVWEDAQEMPQCCDQGIAPSITTIQYNLQIQMYMINLLAVYIDASSDVQIAWPGTPDDFDADPGDTGPEVAQRDRALCFACQSWVNNACSQGLGYLQDFGIEIAPLLGLASFAPIVPVQVVLGAFVASAFALAELASQLADPAYRDYLACGMYEALKGESTSSFAAFSGSMDSLPVRPPPPQSLPENIARDAIETWMRSQLDNQENYLAFVTQLRTAMSIADQLADEDCPCAVEPGEWSHTWLMTSGNDDIIIDPMCGVSGTYNAIDDRYESVKATSPSCSDSGAVSIEIPLPGDGYVTSASMRYDMYNEQFFNRSAVISSVKNFVGGGHVEHAIFTGNQQYFDKLLEAEDVGVVDGLFFSVMNRQTSGTAGRSKVLQVTIEGTGTDPYP